MNRNPLLICFFGLFLFCRCSPELPEDIALIYQDLPENIDFNFHVKPILSDKCFACHGPDAANRQTDLRLDKAENAFQPSAEGGGRRAIHPGKPQRSELINRIFSSNEEEQMPPPESHLTLSDRDKAILFKWVEQGAEYKPHWSFIPPQKNGLPKNEQADWAKNEIDHFILQKLEEEGLEPTATAQKEILLRRLSFALTGLPPTLEEIDAFLSDPSPEAYENQIDRLLAHPAYGERMAMTWMDVARYADSDGYLDDKHRDFSPWRDWVIQAFNNNMPYDQFVTWQLAGDLLPDASRESILATAFNRLHRKNSEAGIVFEEFRTEYVADRTLTLGKAFLGLTLECARCHDHKYDPVSQEDYYRMFGFFNSTMELGTAVYGPDQTPGPSLLLSSQEQEAIADFLQRSIAESEEKLEARKNSIGTALEKWIEKPDDIRKELLQGEKDDLIARLPFDQFLPTGSPTIFSTPVRGEKNQPISVREPIVGEGFKGQALFLNDYTQITLPEKVGWFERTQPFSISLALNPDTLYEEVGIFYHCENLRLGLKGYSLHLDHNKLRFVIAHSWPQNAIQVSTNSALPIDQWTHITITYDGSSRASGLRIYLDGQLASVEVDYDHLYKGILFKWDIHTYGFQGFMLGKRDKMKTFLGGGIDELYIYQRELSALEALHLFNPAAATAVVEQAQLPTSQAMLKAHYTQRHDVHLAALRDSLQRQREGLNQHLDSIPEIMVMGDLPEPRPTFVLDRGNYDAPTKRVEPGVPEAVLPYQEELPENRLGLAQWMFDPQHPLTARVFVNRVWQMHFGRGLVRTADDFGSQGALPTHPELLDWLAVAFRESGWDIKQLHKLILMSATFQQSSRVGPDLLEKDPDNLLLARGPTFRMQAEMVRDNALAISGLLVKKIGGHSVYPYQPEGLWDELSNKSWRYPYLQEPGEGLYRRSLYTIWKRTSPPPSMLIFDAPDRSTCTVTREATSTPLQALVLLNDPQYLEAARLLAERLLTKGLNDPKRFLQQAFRQITGLSPDTREMSILQAYYEVELEHFTKTPQAALDYLTNGEQARFEKLDPAQVAALTTVIHGTMNTAAGITIK